MRISLLLKREPFSKILEQTLSAYWSEKYAKPIKVSWLRPWHFDFRRVAHEQCWLVNDYLNSIFLPEAPDTLFEPIRSEFSYSLVKWRRPIQKSFVRLALSWPTSLIFSTALMLVSPALPQDNQLLIIPGNHKIRLIDQEKRISVAIMKRGFDGRFINNELDSRYLAEELGLPVPVLLDVAEDKSWFSESTISGTPINRLTNGNQATQAQRLACHALQDFAKKTLVFIPFIEYLEGLQKAIQTQIANNHLFSEEQKLNLCALVKVVADNALDICSDAQESLGLVQTHGDFQSANILLDQGRIWLIDWEYSTRRQAGYDLLTLFLQSRHPVGLAGRLQIFENEGPNGIMHDCSVSWPGISWASRKERRMAAHLFLLEELLLHMEENDNPAFLILGQGLTLVWNEIEQWQRQD